MRGVWPAARGSSGGGSSGGGGGDEEWVMVLELEN